MSLALRIGGGGLHVHHGGHGRAGPQLGQHTPSCKRYHILGIAQLGDPWTSKEISHIILAVMKLTQRTVSQMVTCESAGEPVQPA